MWARIEYAGQYNAAEKRKEQYSPLCEEWPILDYEFSGQTNLLEIPRQSGLLTEGELHITDASELANSVRRRDLTCEYITTVFCQVCIILQREEVVWRYSESGNCPWSHQLFDGSLIQERYTGRKIAWQAREGTTISRPASQCTSVPESYLQIWGYDSSISIASLVGHPA